ncbi:hypothetical protein HQ524_03900 [Candidatus Uhrbacteria bacterium]|nr:hypothetical protein [Candidatus Uhrbacteria bacterium]
MIKRGLIFTTLFMICFLSLAPVAFAQTTVEPTPEPAPDTSKQELKVIRPELQVQIPALSFENSIVVGDGKNGCDEGYICVDTLGTYINALYKWGAGAAVIFAIVIIMIGGVEYMIGSSAGTIENAKKHIQNSVIGLLLVFSTTAILSFVNPNITTTKPVRAEILDPIAYVVASGDVSAANSFSTAVPGNIAIPPNPNSNLILKSNMESIGIFCPRTPGSDLEDIYDSFKGKVSYRLGGKGLRGNGPAYSSEVNRENVRKDPNGVPYGYYCPDNTMCLDCSGFLAILSECAGIPQRGESGGTQGIFGSGATKITACGKGTVTLEDGTEHELKQGDYIGFGGQHTKPDEDGNKPTTAKGTEWKGKVSPYGHIWLYVSDKMLVNSAGSGRAPGTALRQQSLDHVCGSYPIYLKPVQ